MQIKSKPRILIVDDEPGFLEKARRNIKKFEVVTALTIPDAVRIISNGGISLIVADIKLKGDARGYAIFDELFHRGESIPAILITGNELRDDDEEYFSSRGAIRTLKKGGGKGTLSARIEETATVILDDENSPFVLFERRIRNEELECENMAHAGSTAEISEWLAVAKKETSVEERIVILKKIAVVCNKYMQHRDSTDYVFPHF